MVTASAGLVIPASLSGHPRARIEPVTSNLALSDWGRYLADTTVAMVILDRLAMNALRVDIDGPSYRQHLAKLRAMKPPFAKGEATGG